MAGRLTFCFELLPALAVLSISPVRPLLLHRARQCSILFCSIFILFCLFSSARFFFWSRYFSAAARSLLRRRTTSTRIRPNCAAPVAQIYNRDYAGSASRRAPPRANGGSRVSRRIRAPCPPSRLPLARELNPSVCSASRRGYAETRCSPSNAQTVLSVFKTIFDYLATI